MPNFPDEAPIHLFVNRPVLIDVRNIRSLSSRGRARPGYKMRAVLKSIDPNGACTIRPTGHTRDTLAPTDNVYPYWTKNPDLAALRTDPAPSDEPDIDDAPTPTAPTRDGTLAWAREAAFKLGVRVEESGGRLLFTSPSGWIRSTSLTGPCNLHVIDMLNRLTLESVPPEMTWTKGPPTKKPEPPKETRSMPRPPAAAAPKPTTQPRKQGEKLSRLALRKVEDWLIAELAKRENETIIPGDLLLPLQLATGVTFASGACAIKNIVENLELKVRWATRADIVASRSVGGTTIASAYRAAITIACKALREENPDLFNREVLPQLLPLFERANFPIKELE